MLKSSRVPCKNIDFNQSKRDSWEGMQNKTVRHVLQENYHVLQYEISNSKAKSECGKIREKAIRKMQARGIKSELRSNDESGIGDRSEDI